MPYIDEERRHQIDEHGSSACAPGELNYQITKLARGYLVRAQGPSYKIINEIIGVLECVKLEFYRRIAAPYENEKQQQNGDVYYPLVEPVPQDLPIGNIEDLF